MTNKEAKEFIIHLMDNFVATEDELQACKMAINALSQEPCEDAVSRAKVVEFLRQHAKDFVDARYRMAYMSASSLVENPNNVPSASPTQGWIPVSEGLPKDNGWYQCTVILNDLQRTMELFYKNGKWLDNRRIDMFNTYDTYGYGCTSEKHKLSYQELISEFDWTENVIAWMPLPQPYKAESEGEE